MIIKKDKIIQFGLSQESDGQMRIGEDKSTLDNRRRYFFQYGIDFKRIVSAGLEHGNRVSVVDERQLGQVIPNSDALVTDKVSIYLTVTVSDCVPIFFYDKKGIIGIAHAGWRGVVSNISTQTIKTMCEKFDSHPTDIKVHIGPHIKKCHFEIKQETANKFKNYLYAIEKRDGKTFISLEKVIKNQLHSVGVPLNNIEISSDCTYCNDRYFSFRRDKPNKVTSQIAYIVQV